jgi:hypothetical protein
MALGALFVPTIGRASQAGPPEAPHPGWKDVVRLLSAPQRAIDAGTVERLLGVTLSRRTRAVDDYDAWMPGRDAKSGASLTLNYRPSPYKGHVGAHVSILQIFVKDMECVSPARMREDLLRTGFTSASSSVASVTLDFYMFGGHRSLRATYPTGPSRAALQVWAINHHTTVEDRRCVEDILVTETG